MVYKSMNIIFLDIDGVLNHELWYEKLHTTLSPYNLSKLTKEEKDIDKDKILLLNEFCEETKSKVVISSTWRIGRTIEELKEMFLRIGATFEIIDKTGKCCSGIRGVEIYNWINKNPEKEINYVIFDDDSDMLLWQRENFFWVDRYCGITSTILYKAKRFLLKIK